MNVKKFAGFLLVLCQSLNAWAVPVSDDSIQTNTLLGAWQDRDHDCKRPFFQFYSSKLIVQDDADGTPTTHTEAIQSYTVKKDEIVVKFKDDFAEDGWQTEVGTVHFLIKSPDRIVMNKPKTKISPVASQLQLFRCPMPSASKKKKGS